MSEESNSSEQSTKGGESSNGEGFGKGKGVPEPPPKLTEGPQPKIEQTERGGESSQSSQSTPASQTPDA